MSPPKTVAFHAFDETEDFLIFTLVSADLLAGYIKIRTYVDL